MDLNKANFLTGEFDRTMVEHAGSDAQSSARLIADALTTGDLAIVNRELTNFMNATAAQSSYEHELAYSIALDGSGKPEFTAHGVPVAVVRTERRDDFE